MVIVEDGVVTVELVEVVGVSEPVEVVEVEELPRSSLSPIDTPVSSSPRSAFPLLESAVQLTKSVMD